MYALGLLVLSFSFFSCTSVFSTSVFFADILAVIFARLQHGPPDCSGQRRTSLASSRLQWAAPDLNSGCQIAVGSAGPTGGLWSGLGNAGPRPGTSRAEWAAPDLSCQKICQKMCQKYVRKECQKECQKICQKKCQKLFHFE